VSERLPVPGVPGTWVDVVRHPRAKRLTLRVSQIDGSIRMTLPKRAHLRAAKSFLADRANWIVDQQEKFSPPILVEYGATLPIEGVEHLIAQDPAVLSIQQGKGTLQLPRKRGAVGPRIAAWLKLLARDRLSERCAHHAAQLDRSYAALKLRDTRSRWGSCTSDGNLMFNWRLILAPSDVLDYVSAHEVAHLVEMNHSTAFWQVVARLMPDYAEHREWLRHHGTTLHRYQFT